MTPIVGLFDWQGLPKPYCTLCYKWHDHTHVHSPAHMSAAWSHARCQLVQGVWRTWHDLGCIDIPAGPLQQPRPTPEAASPPSAIPAHLLVPALTAPAPPVGAPLDAPAALPIIRSCRFSNCRRTSTPIFWPRRPQT